MSNEKSDYQVRAVYCDHKAADEAVYLALRHAALPLERSWAKLRAAKRIAIKFNQDWVLSHVVMFEGQRRQLVSDSVARAVLRLLREETSAELVCVDASFYVMYQDNASTVADTTTLDAVLREFDVPYIDGSKPPYKVVGVPGGGQMFEQYGMMQDVVEADAVVSVAKMKNHAYMGVTAVPQEPLRADARDAMPRPPAPLLPSPGAHALYAGGHRAHPQSGAEHRGRVWWVRPAQSGGANPTWAHRECSHRGRPRHRHRRLRDALDGPRSAERLAHRAVPSRPQRAPGGGRGRLRHGRTWTRSTSVGGRGAA